MKRVNGLYEKLCNRDNISRAFACAMKNKPHYKDVRAIKKDTEKYIDILHDMLINKTFKNGKYEVITRNSGGKIRIIHKLPFFPDRVVHHCIIQVVSDIWIKNLIYDTYSTVPGRGPHFGGEIIKKAVLDIEGAKYCLKLDIKKYYPSIDNQILKTIIRRKIKDHDFLWLLDEIIDSAEGVPIGNYVSQWFGNLYLSYFDHWVKETLRCKYYFRYCDDLVLLAADKQTLWNWLDQIRAYLGDRLKLQIKENYSLFPVKVRGIDFLGYRYFPGYTLVRKRIVKAMKQNLDDPKSKTSYFGWLIHANSFRLTSKYYSEEDYFKRRVA